MNGLKSRKLMVTDPVELEDYTILDVRTATEFFHGHIKGAKNIPIDKLDDWFKVIRDWERPLVICAGQDSRSRRACEKLGAKGVSAIDGGNWITLDEEISERAILE